MSEYPEIEKARQRFAEAKLPFPPIPEEMKPSFTVISDFFFGTRPDATDLYGLLDYVEEVATKPVDDYLLIGHDGRGTSSYAIHYYLVRGPVALFVQRAWGGLHDEPKLAARILEHDLMEVAELLPAIDAARESFDAGERLIGIASDLNSSMWIRTKRLADRDAVMKAEWHEERQSIQALLEQLKSE